MIDRPERIIFITIYTHCKPHLFLNQNMHIPLTLFYLSYLKNYGYNKQNSWATLLNVANCPCNFLYRSTCYFYFKRWTHFCGPCIRQWFMVGFNNLESTLFKNTWIIISKNVAMYRKDFLKKCLYIFLC